MFPVCLCRTNPTGPFFLCKPLDIFRSRGILLTESIPVVWGSARAFPNVHTSSTLGGMLSFFVFVFEAFDIPDVRFPAVDQFEAKFAVKVFHDPDVRQFSGFFVFDVDPDPLLFSIEVLPDRRQ